MARPLNSRLILALALCGAIASPAAALGFGRPCTEQPSNSWKSVEQLTQMLAQQGYTVKSGSFEKRCGDFYVVDKDGKEVELFLDPVSGAIVGRK